MIKFNKTKKNLNVFIYSLGFLSLTLTTLPVHSKGDIQVQYLQDSSDSKDIFLDMAADLSKKTTLLAGVGNTTSPTSAADLDLNYWNIGLAYRYSPAFEFKLETGHVGQGDDINIDNIDAQLRWSSDNWSFSLKPQFDRIKLLFTFNNNSRIRNLDSTGVGVTLSYYGMQNWEYNLSYDSYHYSTDPRILSTRIAALLSSKAIAVSSGLKDHVISADISYLFAKTDLNLSYARSQSAIDQTTSDIASISTTFYQFLPYQLGFEAGAVSSDVDTASYYAGFTAGYRW